MIKNMDCHKRRLYIGVCMCVCKKGLGGGEGVAGTASYTFHVCRYYMCVYNSHDHANNELM